MARVMVTGAAGFIGSHLVERLLADGHQVIAVDACRGVEGAVRAARHLGAVIRQPGFELLVRDLARADLRPLLQGVDCVFHLAGRPGVRDSWGPEFAAYAEDNILATQRLAEALRESPVAQLVFASTSSVYGGAPSPFRPDGPTLPISPYGVTKLAAESLLRAYAVNFGLRVTVLRYFTVFGPRQRPDMAFSRWLRAVQRNEPVVLYGEGSRRDFTYVSDAVEATARAMSPACVGRTYNVASGSSVRLEDVVELIRRVSGRRVKVVRTALPPGDAPATLADLTDTARDLGYCPAVSLAEGLRRQWQWLQQAGDAI